jgi:neutral ceramidase
MRRLPLAALLLLVEIASASCASAPAARAGSTDAFVVGVAAVDITPAEPIRLTGYGNRTSPTSVVNQRLRAKALAFGADQQQPSVLITTDLIGVSAAIVDAVARRLEPAEIDRARLAITASHTHTGPSISGMLPHIFSSPITTDEARVIDRYSTELTDKLAGVALAALADRRPARVEWGQGTARFAANRRVLKDGKWTAFGIEPGGPVDRDLPMLAVRAPDGALRAVLVNYACHATTFGGNDNFIHGDWPGSAQTMIEQRFPNAVALVSVGAGADANPNPRGGGIQDVERHAREVASEVERLLGTPLTRITAPPTGRLQALQIAFSRIPSRSEWEAQAAGKDAIAHHARAVLARLDKGTAIPTTAPYRVQTWTFGRELAMVFLAGEVVSDYSLRLKRELDGTRLWVTAYANDVPFYVASRRMIPEGGYEVDRSMTYYGQPSALAADTEDRIIGTVREMLAGTFAK